MIMGPAMAILLTLAFEGHIIVSVAEPTEPFFAEADHLVVPR